MQQVIIDLDNKQQRPVTILENGLTALLDTGAYIPVWVDDEDILIENLGAKLVMKDVPLTGFGGTTKGNMYQVTVKIGTLLYPNMHMIANNELQTPFNMILSATMFQNLIYEIDDKNHKLNITVPDNESLVRNLVIKSSDGRLNVFCNSEKCKNTDLLL